MKGVWLEDKKLSVRDDIDMSQPGPGEALVKVIKAGICATDLELLKGYYPFNGIPGHEFVGKVVECPDDPSLEGVRVTATINIGCGKCPPCQRQRPSHCVRRKVLGINGYPGAFAEYLKIPMNNIVLVPNDISDEAAVFIEPLAAALRIQEQVSISPVDRVLVLGGGKLGQLIAQSLLGTGCSLQVAARYPKQKALLEKARISWLEQQSISPGHFDLVVEATGSPEGFSLAQTAVRPEGVIVLKSTFKEQSTINLSPVAVDEITIIGSRCGRFEPAIDLLQQQKLNPALLVDGEYKLIDAPLAFEKAGMPGVMKILLTP